MAKYVGHLDNCTVIGCGAGEQDLRTIDFVTIFQALYGVRPLRDYELSGRICIQLGLNIFDMRELLEAAEKRRDALVVLPNGEPIATLLADASAMRKLTQSDKRNH